MHFSSRTPPILHALLPYSGIHSVLSRIRWMFSRPYALRPHLSPHVQPFLLHSLIPAHLLPYLVEIPPLFPFRAAFFSALHILSCLVDGSRRLPGLLQSAGRLLPSSSASNSAPGSFPCLSTYSCLIDDLPKPAQLIIICLKYSHAC